MNTPIFTREEIVRYAETRLFGKNVTPKMVSHIRLYNAVLPSELEQFLNAENGSAERVVQDSGREPLWYTSGKLHIPQYSGFGRRRRYEAMIQAYVHTQERYLTFESLERNHHERTTNIYYDNFAYDFVKDQFMQKEMNSINTIIIGPTAAVAQQASVLQRKPCEYLDSQLLVVGEQTIFNMGYVYADQAGIILDKTLREYEALARKEKNPRQISIYMFGRVGGLKPEMRRQEMVLPHGIIDDVDLTQGRALVYPMHNILAPSSAISNVIVNVPTVIGETRGQLEQARDNGAIAVEMETREAVEAINRARRRYQGKLQIQFGFAGYISDLPLQSDTLALELNSNEGEQAVVAHILEHIRQKKVIK